MLDTAVRKTPHFARMALGLMLSLCMGGALSRPASQPGSVVFYYGDQPAERQLSRFDVAVVEPDTGFVPPVRQGKTHTRWFAYVSVGETSPSRDYYPAIPPAWIIGRNEEWQAGIMDQTAPGWPDFFVEHVITPLWNKGYTGFFLDTLDSYVRVSSDALYQAQSQAGLVRVIQAIRTKYPASRLILNRGFELLPAVHDQVYAVAFESLFKGWSEADLAYVDVPAEDRAWLRDQARHIMRQYKLPVIAIDYCPPADRQCATDTIRRIRALGMIPYVGDGRLQEINTAALD